MSSSEVFEYIASHTLRLEASRRGGGIEIDASEFLGAEDARMTAYQNYLGGGMLGAIQSDANYAVRFGDQEKATVLSEALKRYFHEITSESVHDWDDWADAPTFEALQSRPTSAY